MDFADQDDTGYSEAWRGAARGGLSVLDLRGRSKQVERLVRGRVRSLHNSTRSLTLSKSFSLQWPISKLLRIKRTQQWNIPNITVGKVWNLPGNDHLGSTDLLVPVAAASWLKERIMLSFWARPWMAQASNSAVPNTSGGWWLHGFVLVHAIETSLAWSSHCWDFFERCLVCTVSKRCCCFLLLGDRWSMLWQQDWRPLLN